MQAWPHWGPLLIGFSFENEPVLLDDLLWAISEVEEWLRLKLKSGSVAQGLVGQLALSYCRLPILESLPHLLVNVHEVWDQIGKLEGAPLCRPSPTKLETQWSGGPLKGLWHKHWTQAAFMSHNLQAEFESKGMSYVMRSLRSTFGAGLDTGVEINQAVAGQIAHAAVIDTYQGRANRQKSGGGLTGEWIVYARLQERNFYLTLATHHERKESILARCREAIREFPELGELSVLA